MKRKIPSQLIVFAALIILAAFGWKYIYSCRDEVIINLQTITGDPTCLSDKQFDIQCASGYSRSRKVWNLDIGFPSGPALNQVTYGSKTFAKKVSYSIDVDHGYRDSENLFSFYISGFDGHDILTSLQLKDERDSIPEEFYPEHISIESTYIQGIFVDESCVLMEGIAYFTIPNHPWDPIYYQCEYSNSEYQNCISSVSYPVEYTAMSGIWVFDESSDASAENVAPCVISSDSTSLQVDTIYASEAESAIILLTVDKGVDLYATVYDTKTKITHDPVLIFHSDFGDFRTFVIDENSTCPLGSIIVKPLYDNDELIAVALKKNDITGNIEAVRYDIERMYPIMARYDIFFNYSELEKMSVFYRGEEAWIISDVTSNFLWRIMDEFAPDNPEFPYSNPCMQKISVVGIKNDTIFYEGLLSFDFTAADAEPYLNYDVTYDNYRLSFTGNDTQTEIY
jgi:hypothetical protein